MNKQTRFYSKRQEKKVARAVSGKTTANSGATTFSKGDVQTDLFLLECKTKIKPSESMTIKKDWIKKNEEEAFMMNKPYSAVVINFGDKDNYYLIDQKLFKKLLVFLEDEK